MKRVVSAILGLLLLFLVIFFGVRATSGNPMYTLLFGLSCAFIAPISIMAFGYSFRRNDPILEKLAKLPKIDEMIQEVETQEETIKRLTKEKKELFNYIDIASEKYALLTRKTNLEKEAAKIISEYNEVEKMLLSFSEVDSKKSDVIEQLNQEIQYRVENKNQQVKISIFGFSNLLLEPIIEPIINEYSIRMRNLMQRLIRRKK